VELKPFVAEEVNPDQVKALVDAFGRQQVPTVDDLPTLEGWNTERWSHTLPIGACRWEPIRLGAIWPR
jgi:hypothetical protein